MAAHSLSRYSFHLKLTILSEGGEEGQAGAADIHQLLIAAHSISRYSFHLK
jgi:hypothetical protein